MRFPISDFLEFRGFLRIFDFRFFEHFVSREEKNQDHETLWIKSVRHRSEALVSSTTMSALLFSTLLIICFASFSRCGRCSFVALGLRTVALDASVFVPPQHTHLIHSLTHGNANHSLFPPCSAAISSARSRMPGCRVLSPFFSDNEIVVAGTHAVRSAMNSNSIIAPTKQQPFRSERFPLKACYPIVEFNHSTDQNSRPFQP